MTKTKTHVKDAKKLIIMERRRTEHPLPPPARTVCTTSLHPHTGLAGRIRCLSRGEVAPSCSVG